MGMDTNPAENSERMSTSLNHLHRGLVKLSAHVLKATGVPYNERSGAEATRPQAGLPHAVTPKVQSRAFSASVSFQVHGRRQHVNQVVVEALAVPKHPILS